MERQDQHRVLVIGGTGFIGSYIVKECLKQNYSVTILSRSGKGAFDCEYLQGDILELTSADYEPLLQGIDKIVFAAGADERSGLEEDPYGFYYKNNIEPCIELFTAARKSQVSHAVLLNSVFTMMHRLYPDLELADKHPYIRSRVKQSQVSHDLAHNHFVLTSIEVPWVFGLPGSGQSQWFELVQYARNSSPLFSCQGGASIVAIESLAEACVAALSKPARSSSLPVADTYLSFDEMLELICDYSDRTKPRIVRVDEDAFQDIMSASGLIFALFGMRSGIELRHAPELVTLEIKVDITESQSLLGYSTGTALPALKAVVNSVEENRYAKAWRKTLNFFRA